MVDMEQIKRTKILNGLAKGRNIIINSLKTVFFLEWVAAYVRNKKGRYYRANWFDIKYTVPVQVPKKITKINNTLVII